MSVRFPSDLGIRFLALVIAIALWFVAAGETHTRPVSLEERVVTATVRLVGVAPDLIPVNRTGSVEVRLRMPSGTSVPETIDAYVDMSGKRAGEHKVPITIVLPPRYTVVNTSPQYAAVRLEQQITRTFPVELTIVGMPPGVSLTANPPDPSTTTLTGAATRVNRVARVLATVTYDPDAASLPATLHAVDNTGADIVDVTIKPRQVKVSFAPTIDGLAEGSGNEEPAALQQTPTAPASPPHTTQPAPRVGTTPKQPPKPVAPTQGSITATDQG